MAFTRSWSDKDPDATVLRSLDLEAEIRAMDDADTLSTASWAATPSGLTLTGQDVDGFVAPVLISGGTDRTRYLVVCTFTTAGGLTSQRTLPLFVTEL